MISVSLWFNLSCRLAWTKRIYHRGTENLARPSAATKLGFTHSMRHCVLRFPQLQAQTNGGRPFPSSPSVRSTNGRDRRDGDDERGSPKLFGTVGGWIGGIAKGPERTMRNVFQQNSVGEPLRRRLRTGLSPRELEVDAKAEAEGASPSVEPSGGFVGNCGVSLRSPRRMRAGETKVQRL